MKPVENMATDLPLAFSAFDLAGSSAGLVIVDEVNGFCKPGAGPLAPPAFDERIDSMVRLTDSLARQFSERRWPMLAFLDTHEPDRPEPPYPPHCIRGTGDEELVDRLAWLQDCPDATSCPQGLHQRLRRRDRTDSSRPTALTQSLCRLGQRAPPRSHRHRRRDLHGYLRDGLRAHHALGAQPRAHAGAGDGRCAEPACATYDLPLDAATARPARDSGPPEGRNPPHGALFHGLARCDPR
ncbi:MAG: isochorismatase family protein [Geminicoccaceae bacterium]